MDGNTKPTIEILDTGLIDHRDSAFPQAVQLSNGDLLCSFNVCGGPNVSGGTDWARSTNGGKTWDLQGTILPKDISLETTNALKLSISKDGGTIFAYGSRHYRDKRSRFGEGRNEPIVCISNDGGNNWGGPKVIELPFDCPLEISHGILPLSSGKLLAPAALLTSPDKLGDRVVAAVSYDGGKSWPEVVTLFEDPLGHNGYFEQKLAEISTGKLIATSWTVTLSDVKDLENSYVISNDDGRSWSLPIKTGIFGQTMTPIPLGADRFLVLYNRRYGSQGIVMVLVEAKGQKWEVVFEDLLYDAMTEKDKPENMLSGVEEFYGFEFGFPTAIRLLDGNLLATHWMKKDGKFGIMWTKLRIGW